MKKILINFLQIAVCSFANAQDTITYNFYDTIYYDKDYHIVTVDSFQLFELRYRNEIDTNKVKIIEYYSSGQLKSEEFYSNYYNTNKEKKARYWYENGQLWSEVRYIAGLQHGKSLMFRENGILKREEIYSNGKLIQGKCFGIDGKDTTYFEYEKMPEFPGGIDALYEFMSEKTKYPRGAQKEGKEGKALIQFMIDTNGSIVEIELLKSADNELLDEEAIRVVKAMPKWKPAMQDGKAVKLRMTLPFEFKLQ